MFQVSDFSYSSKNQKLLKLIFENTILIVKSDHFMVKTLNILRQRTLTDAGTIALLFK